MHPAPEGANAPLYLTLVYLHILLSLMAVGMNATYGIWIARAGRDPAVLSFVLKGVGFIDDRVANPLYIAAGVTGFLMVGMGKPIKPFLWVSIVLYFLVMAVAYAVYTPLLRRQIRVLEERGAEDTEYRRLANLSNGIGAGMGAIALIIVLLKIYEPPFG